MPWAWPVECNYHEAKAFAAWRASGQGGQEDGGGGRPAACTSCAWWQPWLLRMAVKHAACIGVVVALHVLVGL